MNTAEKVMELIVEQGGADPETTTLETVLGSVGMDSISTVELVMELEIAFDIELANDEIDPFFKKTIQELVNYIDSKL
jgi:acyl carrier protein